MSWPVNVSLQSVSGMLFEPEFTKHFDRFGGMSSHLSVTLKGAESSASPEQERQPGKLMFSIESKCSLCFVLYTLNSRCL